MEKRSVALISWAVVVLGFGVFTCYRSYFFYYSWFSSRIKSGWEKFCSIKQLSFQCVHYTQMLIPLKFYYNQQRAHICGNPFAWMHKKFSSVFCAGRSDALSVQRFPPGSPFGWKVRDSAFHFVLQAKPVPLKHMEISSRGAECLMWGCPCCLPEGRSSFFPRKHFCSLFSINQVFHIKKGRKQGKLFLFNHWILFSWWFSTIREPA